MSRKYVVLNVVLLALAGVLGWQLRTRWLDAQAKEREILARQIAAKTALAPALPTPPAAAAPAEYVDVAQKTLFSKDRNPNVVVEPPKPAPELPMPALPRYHGQMGFGGNPVAFLSVNNGAQKGYHAGEDVGDFKLSGFDGETIALEWHGRKVEKRLEELAVKDAAPPVAASSAPAGPSNAQPNSASAGRNNSPEVRSTATVTTIIAPPSGSNGNTISTSGSVPSAIGPEIGGGLRSCVPTDDSPSGTVLSGFRKNILKTMFGEICRWEPK